MRILVTVGTELPFDRLVSAVDEWAAEHRCADDVLAQIGRSKHPPAHIKWAPFIDGSQFREYFCKADLIVSHAGMGTILTALRYEKPLLIVPRRASLGEHRSDHQCATAKRLFELGRVDVAMDENELLDRLDARRLEPKEPIGPHADQSLLDAIRTSIAALDTRP